MSDVKIVKANYANPQHQQDIPFLLDQYASDPMGGGAALDENVKSHLTEELAKIPHAFSVIAYLNNQPAGLANCFEGFSTFSCRPLINIHDLVVLSEFRGQGISRKILEKIEEIARQKHCCKITLEVLSHNQLAQSAYRNFGFSGYELDPTTGPALFWQKKL